MKSTVQELHKQYNQYEGVARLYLIHQFDKKSKTWQFNHYQCIHCGNNMKYASSITKHPQVCKQLNKVLTRVKEEPDIILTKGRTLWNPLYEQYSK
jgi:hypothetical protein